MPELESSFEGFGAKLEVGLPFLRAAGVPLPPDAVLTSITVDEGAIVCKGEVRVRPIDYAEVATQLEAALSMYTSSNLAPPDAVTVDVDSASGEDQGGGSASAGAALGPSRQR